MFLTIITPCYNHGKYLDEMHNSVHDFNWPFEIEHIIINDGSTDDFTIEKLGQLSKKENTKIIIQDNFGLGQTRNNALKAAKGKYILPLDADNKIEPSVFTKAVDLLENMPDISVIYTNRQFFDGKNFYNEVGDFNIQRLLTGNYIDACALVRKDVLLNVGGWATDMPAMGHEDWELWIKLHHSGYKFFYLAEKGFYYRHTESSMLQTVTNEKFEDNRKYIITKYSDFFAEQFDELRRKYEILVADKTFINNNKIRTIAKIFIGKKIFSE